MKTVKQRDFQRGFRHYRDEDCEVIGAEGVVGYWKAGSIESEKCKEPTKKEVADEIVDQVENKGILEVRAARISKITMKGESSQNISINGSNDNVAPCDFCNIEKMHLWYKWEDGEEWKICKDCLGARVPPGHLKKELILLKPVEIEPPQEIHPLTVPYDPFRRNPTSKMKDFNPMPKPKKKKKK